MIKIGLGSDHAGFPLKKHIQDFLNEQYADRLMVQDFGCTEAGHSVDYPLIAQALCQPISTGELASGILVCGSGVGMSIAANKAHPQIRAALCYNSLAAGLAREHNDANVLCLGAWLVAPRLAQEILAVWLKTSFSMEERHARRIQQLNPLE